MIHFTTYSFVLVCFYWAHTNMHTQKRPGSLDLKMFASEVCAKEKIWKIAYCYMNFNVSGQIEFYTFFSKELALPNKLSSTRDVFNLYHRAHNMLVMLVWPTLARANSRHLGNLIQNSGFSRSNSGHEHQQLHINGKHERVCFDFSWIHVRSFRWKIITHSFHIPLFRRTKNQ